MSERMLHCHIHVLSMSLSRPTVSSCYISISLQGADLSLLKAIMFLQVDIIINQLIPVLFIFFFEIRPIPFVSLFATCLIYPCFTTQVMSVKAMSLILLWCKQIKKDALLSSAFTFMWQFFWRTTRSPHSFSEVPGLLDVLSAIKIVFLSR